MPVWDANLYLKYADERARPAADLIAQIHIDAPARIVDLGCGPGNSTEQLRQRWPDAATTGVDNSPEMLGIERYRNLEPGTGSRSDLFQCGISLGRRACHPVSWHDQWRGDGRSFGSADAKQFSFACHSVIREAALNGDPRWARAMAAVPGTLAVQPPAFYYDVLRKHASRLDIWETEYQHVMDGPKAVFDWIHSTGMRPYLDRLADAEQRQLFEELCLEGMQKAYRPNDPGKVLFPFRRMFIVAYR